jgi:uracil-DNA glycosylase
VIFALWGKSAEKKVEILTLEQRKVHPFLITSHPSPLSAYQGFLGCRHFSKINELLEQNNKTPIDWL